MSGRKEISPFEDGKGKPLCDCGHRFVSHGCDTCIRCLSRWTRYRDQFYEWYKLEPERRLYESSPPRPICSQRTPPPNSVIERTRLTELEKGPAPMDHDWNHPEGGKEGPSKTGRSAMSNAHDTDEMEDVVKELEIDSQDYFTAPGSSEIRAEVSSPRILGPKESIPDVVQLEATQDELSLTEPSDPADSDLPPPVGLSPSEPPRPVSPALDPIPEAKKEYRSIAEGLRERAAYRKKHGSWGAKAVFCDAENFTWGNEEFFGPGSASVPFQGATKGPYSHVKFDFNLIDCDTESDSESTLEGPDSYLTRGLKTTAGVINKLKTKVEGLSKSKKENEEAAGANGWFGQVKTRVGKTASQLLQVRDFRGLVEACRPDFVFDTTARILERTESSLKNRIKQRKDKRKREKKASDARPNKEAKRNVSLRKAKRT